MSNADGRAWYGIGLDTSQLQNDAKKAMGEFDKIDSHASAASKSIDKSFQSAAKAAGVLFTIGAASQFIQKVSDVRGEFQQLEIAFTTMLHSEEKATKLMNQLAKTAAATPFDLAGVATGAKQLLAYGFELEKINDTIVTLGDIASGVSAPLNDIVYLYGTLRASGRVMTVDVRQFANRGIPIYEELARVLKVDKEAVSELVTEGRVGFKEIEQAFKNMTSEGGNFANLMEKQSQSITGLKSNLRDAIAAAENDLGKKMQSTIEGVLRGAIDVAENFDQVGKAVVELVAIYGSYKAAIIANNVLQKVSSSILRQAVLEKRLAAAASIELSNAEAMAAARSKLFAVAQAGVVKSLKATAAAMVSNPYAIVAAGLVAVAFAVKNAVAESREMENAFKDASREALSEQRELARLKGQLAATKKGTEEYNSIRDDVVKKYGQYNQNLSDEIDKVGLLDQTYKDLSKSIAESYNTREYEAFMADQNEDLNKKMSKSFDRLFSGLTKKYGDELGSKYFQEVKTAILTEAAFSEDLKKAVFGVGKGNITDEISKLRMASNYFKAVQKEAKLKFNIGSTEADISELLKPYKELFKKVNEYGESELKETKAKLVGLLSAGLGEQANKEIEAQIKAVDERLSSTVSKRIQQLTEDLKGQEDKLLSMRSGSSLSTAKEIEEQTKIVDELKKQIQTLTGVKEKDTKKDSLQEIQDRKDAIEGQKKALIEATIDAEDEIQQAKISIMEDGYAKERAQIELNYRKTQTENRRFADGLIKDRQELERQIWEGENPNYKETGKVFTPTTTSVLDLPKDQQAQIEAKEYQANADRLANTKKTLDALLAEYADFAQQRKDIEDKYIADVAELEAGRTGDNSGEIDRAIAEAKKRRDQALKGISNEEIDAAVKDSDLLVQVFDDASKMSQKRLKELLSKVREIINYLSGISTKIPEGITKETLEKIKQSPEEMKALYEQLAALQTEYDSKIDYPFSGFIKGFSNISKAGKIAKEDMSKLTAEQKRSRLAQADYFKQTGIQQIGENAVSAAGYVTGLADALRSLGDATGNGQLAEQADAIGAVAQNFSAAGQGFASSGSWIGAVIGGAQDLISQTIGAFTDIEQEEYEYEQNQIDFANAYTLLMLSLKDTDYESVFGTREIEKARDAWENALEALEKYNNYVSNTRDTDRLSKLLGKTSDFFLGDSANNTDLQNMSVKTTDRTGFANFWGAKDKYTKLSELAPELWDENNEFDVDAAKAFLETNTQITDEQRKQIQQAIDLKEAYDDAISVIDEELKSIFGNLAENITDSIFDAVRNGTDAWEEFEEVGMAVIDKLGKQLIQEMYIQAYLDQFQDDLRAAYAGENPQEELANIMTEIYAGLQPVVEGAYNAAAAWDQSMRDQGWDTSTLSDSQSASAKSFQALSEETGSELNGRFTAIQMSAAVISDSIKMIQPDISRVKECSLMMTDSLLELRDLSLNGISLLTKIEKNTNELYAVNEKLDKIEKNTRGL